MKLNFFKAINLQVGAVVVGFDKNINYYKIQFAQLCIDENPGCLFIATNLDAKTHLTDAQEWAGNGSMVGAIKGADLCIAGCELLQAAEFAACQKVCLTLQGGLGIL